MKTKILGAGRFLRFVEADSWEYVERQKATGVVAIVAVTEDARLLLVEQFRAPVGQRVIELPAGLCGDEKDEPLTEAARRELVEETGYDVVGNFEMLCTVPSSAGLTNEVVTVFATRGVRKVAAGGGVGGENITVHAIALSELEAWIAERARAGVLIDAKVFLGLYFTQRKIAGSR